MPAKKVTDILSSAIPNNLQIVKPFQIFFKKIVSGSFPLFLAAIAALLWANLSAESYYSVWHTELSLSVGHFEITKSLIEWIDEALMTFFFFTVGLEIKREVLVGELASPSRAFLPIAAAIGGMLVPAMIYAAFNYNTTSAHGWGIPMATDIAFSLAVLAVLGKRIPFSLRIFLSAFAIADDLGAVLVIALFYTKEIAINYLFIAGFFLAALLLANLLWIRNTLVYALLGIGLWFFILGSGVHATVAGVLLAMFIPAKGKYDTDTFIKKVKSYLSSFECANDRCGFSILLNKDHFSAVHNIEIACHKVETPLQRLENSLESFIAFVVMPLFALANTGLVLKGMDIMGAISHHITLGIALGLAFGKPIGISLFTWLAHKFFKIPLPTGVNWTQIVGVSILGGIGFTMSLFISGLSFKNPEFTDFSKLGIILGSLFAGITGLLVLRFGNKNLN